MAPRTSSMDSNPDAIFVYGTLLLPVVQRRILGRSLAAEEAVLDGYARGVVRGQTYPSLRVAPGGETSGAVLSGVTAEDFDLLDAYEGDRYERVVVPVNGKEEPRCAWVWLLRGPWQDLVTTEPWDLDVFIRDELDGYLESYEGLQG